MIKLQSVSKEYLGQTVVNNVSLQVQEQSVLALVGGSGAGKTTLLKMINGLEKPTRGRVCLDGEDVGDLPSHELCRKVGYVFQAVGLFPHMTVAENVGITPTLLHWDRQRIHQRVDELLNMVELEPGRDRGRKPGELSGGQQQRVGVARALAARPRVILMDEPFGALDPVTRERVQHLFLRIQRSLGFTSVLVTHDIAEAILLADRIGVMEMGELVQVGEPRELFENPVARTVAQLMTAPKRQADQIERLLADRHARRGPHPVPEPTTNTPVA